MDRKSLFSRLKSFPKVELHRHLEGCITAEMLISVADKYGGELPVYTLEELRPLIQVVDDEPGFQNFLNKFKVFRGFYPCREAIEDIVYAAVAEAAEDCLKYLELRYSPSHFACNGRFNENEVVEWIDSTLNRASKDFDIIILPILTISRDYGLELAADTVELATRIMRGRFYGLDIAGDEVSNSAMPFSRLFSSAKKANMGLTVHAGEACGAMNVRQAVSDFNADRIGHGVRSIEDESVLALLREKDVMLELCITSNFHTGVVESIEKHPVKLLKDAGVPVSINTDDPAILATTLTDEYVAAVETLSLTESELAEMNIAALKHGFHPDKEKLFKQLRHFWE